MNKDKMVLKHDGIGITSEDIETTKDSSFLKDCLSEIMIDVTFLKNEISKAKTQGYTTGEYADPEWFHRIKTKKRIYSAMVMKIQARLRVLKEDKKISTIQIERDFYRAKLREVYDSTWHIIQRELDDKLNLIN